MIDATGVTRDGHSLTNYFYRSLAVAARDRRLTPQPVTVRYVAELLTSYGDARRLFDFDGERTHLPALADLYRQALETDSIRERKAFLQRLGDVALFVAGLFPGYLERRVVGVDYYIAMGSNAYNFLDHDLAHGAGLAGHSPFSELASSFQAFVHLLSDLGGRGAPDQASPELERLVARWGREPTTLPPLTATPPTLRH
ncbi:MAG: hypothetical protein U5S82_09190 [Gammaproteobacteria bacterium]|nr:hypothetical protein [Gammaproteobacteria bacterium]